MNKYRISHCNGYSLNDNIKNRTLKLSNDGLAGVCSVVYLLSKTLGVIMLVYDENDDIVDPEEFIKPYAKSSERGIFSSIKRHYAFLSHLGNDLHVEFDSTAFLDGMDIACKCLQRNYKRLILDSDLMKKSGTRSVDINEIHYTNRISVSAPSLVK